MNTIYHVKRRVEEVKRNEPKEVDYLSVRRVTSDPTLKRLGVCQKSVVRKYILGNNSLGVPVNFKDYSPLVLESPL